MENEHCFHAYIGDGKGKTTCCVGLALRHAGQNGRVLFTQFLKSNTSGELKPLGTIDNITVFLGKPTPKFVFAMSADELAAEKAAQNEYFDAIDRTAVQEHPTMIICDELFSAVETGLIDAARAQEYIERWLKGAEVVATGRNAPENLLALADYVTQMRKIKHPFDRGLPARRGVEF